MSLSLTPQQKNSVFEAYGRLKSGEMVFLRGRQNGKTRMVQHTLEIPPKGRSSAKILTARHPEDNNIRFIKNVGYGRSDQMTIYTLMRQVLMAVDVKPDRGHWNLSKQFETVLAERRDAGEVVCVAIDNADLLPARAYTILKHLNELRAGGKNVGTAVLLAGEFGKMRMPIEFLYRCTELQIDKLYNTDIAQLIEVHWPGTARQFDEKAIECIRAQSETLLEARRCLELVRRKQRELDMDNVTLPLVQRALALAA